VLAARNRRFAVAASSVGVGWLFLAVHAILEVVHLPDGIYGGYVIGAALTIGVYLVGACGWMTLATAFRAEIDWRRLRLDATIVIAVFIADLAALIFRLVPTLAHVHNGDYRAIFIWATVAALLLAIGACLAGSGFPEARQGSSRAWRLWLGAIFVTSYSAATTVSQLFQRSFLSSLDAPHELTIGALAQAVGAFGLTLAVLAFVLGARRPLAGRESRLAVAAAGAAAASVCTGGGEMLIAIAYTTHPEPTWLNVTLWLAVAGRAFLVAAFIALALGARAARPARAT
jgi:hypothetical protein